MLLWRNMARAARRLPVSAVRCWPQPRRAEYKLFHSTPAFLHRGIMMLRQKLSTLSGPSLWFGNTQLVLAILPLEEYLLRHNSSGIRTGAIKGNDATDSGVFVSPTTPFTAARRPKKYASANTPCASTRDTNALTAFSASSNVYCFVGFDFPHLCEVLHVMPSCQGLTSILPDSMRVKKMPDAKGRV